MPCPNKRKGHDENSPGSPDTKRRILQKRSLSNQMNTPIRIKNFLLLQRFANQHHRNPKKTEFILLRQSVSNPKKICGRKLPSSSSPIKDIRKKAFLFLFSHRNPQKTEFILVRQSEKRGSPRDWRKTQRFSWKFQKKLGFLGFSNGQIPIEFPK